MKSYRKEFVGKGKYWGEAMKMQHMCIWKLKNKNKTVQEAKKGTLCWGDKLKVSQHQDIAN